MTRDELLALDTTIRLTGNAACLSRLKHIRVRWLPDRSGPRGRLVERLERNPSSTLQSGFTVQWEVHDHGQLMKYLSSGMGFLADGDYGRTWEMIGVSVPESDPAYRAARHGSYVRMEVFSKDPFARRKP